MTESQVEFAMKAARKIEKIRNPIQIKEKPTKSKKYQNTDLVNKKNNYKECVICSKLCINMSDHIQKTHKVHRSHRNYDNYIENAKVIPKVYTKIQDGVRVQLRDTALEDAKEVYADLIGNQQTTLEKLKKFRKNLVIERTN